MTLTQRSSGEEMMDKPRETSALLALADDWLRHATALAEGWGNQPAVPIALVERLRAALSQEWQTEWPIEDGSHWWFYGDLWGDATRNKFSLAVVHKISNGVLVVADGQIMSKREAVGVWSRAVLPAVPTLPV